MSLEDVSIHHEIGCLYASNSVIGLVFFSFQNSPKNLDPSYKMDLDFWICFRMEKNHLVAESA